MEKEGYYLLGVIAGLYAYIIVRFLMMPSSNYYSYFVRFFALTGLYFLCISALLTPFAKKITQIFNKPWTKLHHFFGAIGLASATLHPIVYFLRVKSLSIFIPDVSSWYNFWLLAGRPALYIMYVAVVAVIFRKMFLKYWRIFHSLMYVVIFLVLVHGILIGTDFASLDIMVIFSGLFVGSMGAFVYNRF